MWYFYINLHPHLTGRFSPEERMKAENTQTASEVPRARFAAAYVCCTDEELDALILFQSLNR